jgi:hypothetical protein
LWLQCPAPPSELDYEYQYSLSPAGVWTCVESELHTTTYKHWLRKWH